jgi:hypothetical protein
MRRLARNSKKPIRTCHCYISRKRITQRQSLRWVTWGAWLADWIPTGQEWACSNRYPTWTNSSNTNTSNINTTRSSTKLFSNISIWTNHISNTSHSTISCINTKRNSSRRNTSSWSNR